MRQKTYLQHISIHTPAKGVTLSVVCLGFIRLDFNPHSREGSDDYGKGKHIGRERISIHTPAKGVTGGNVPETETGVYFNPHSREGSDSMLHCRSSFSIYFNPHSREGSDRVFAGLGAYVGISIHTPAKGVTASVTDTGTDTIFQSTLPRRE